MSADVRSYCFRLALDGIASASVLVSHVALGRVELLVTCRCWAEEG